MHVLQRSEHAPVAHIRHYSPKITCNDVVISLHKGGRFGCSGGVRAATGGGGWQQQENTSASSNSCAI